MNSKQTNEDKIYVYSSFNQVCLPVHLFLVLFTALNWGTSRYNSRLVSSRLVSPVPWHLGRSRFHLFVYGSSQKNDIIFLQTCLLPGHPLRYMCYPLWADHSLSVTGWFTSFYAKKEAFSWLKRQSWGKTRFNMKKFSKSEPLWNVGYLKAAVDIILLIPTFMVLLYPW